MKYLNSLVRMFVLAAALAVVLVPVAPSTVYADGSDWYDDYNTGYYNVYDTYTSNDWYDSYDTSYYNSYDTYSSYSNDWYDDYNTGYYNVYDTYTSNDWYDSYDTSYYNSYDTYYPSYNDYSYYTPQPVYDYQEQYYVYDDYYYTPPTYNPPTYNPPHYNQPDCSIDASRTTIREGDSVTLRWTASYASSATLSGFGNVDERSGSKSVHPNTTTTYTLKVSGNGGNDTCSTTVRVEKQTNQNLVCDITATDRSIEKGDTTTLRWTSEGADHATINQGIGNVNDNDSEQVHPTRDTTYTLTVENDEGDDYDCSVTIRVDDNDSDLWCELTASDRSIESGDSVTLRWDTRDADDASINQGIGRVDEDGGSERVHPTRDTKYTLTVENDNGDDYDCSVTINVDDGLAPPPDQPIVYLSQLPYTGAGDTMTYWLLLIAGSGLVGYFLFFRALPFAMARVHSAPAVVADASSTGEGEVASQNVTRQEVRAFVSALAEGDKNAAREFAHASGMVLFSEAAVVLDDAHRARENGVSADPMIAEVTKDWDSAKFDALISAFADADDADTVLDEALKN